MNSIASSHSGDEIIANDTTLEESSWAMYIENFLATTTTTNTNNNNIIDDDDQERSSFSLDDPNSSRIAAAVADVVVSSVAKKQDEEVVAGLSINRRYSRSLSFKKRRNRGANLVDEALEDTASSPVNSPKIYDIMDQFKKDVKQKDTQESDKTELKRRGLCLVPVSMVVNYMG